MFPTLPAIQNPAGMFFNIILSEIDTCTSSNNNIQLWAAKRFGHELGPEPQLDSSKYTKESVLEPTLTKPQPRLRSPLYYSRQICCTLRSKKKASVGWVPVWKKIMYTTHLSQASPRKLTAAHSIPSGRMLNASHPLSGPGFTL